MPLADHDIMAIVNAEEADAIGFQDELGQKRETLIKYFNQEPFGGEVQGRSTFVSSDVSDVVLWLLPSLVRMFTQRRQVFQFQADLAQADDEAQQKTDLANYVFMRQNNGTRVLHDAFMDGLLQYTGTVKVSWEDAAETTTERYKGLSEQELAVLRAEAETEVVEEELLPGIDGNTYNAVVKRTSTFGKVRYDNIPPEEFLVSRQARDFERPRFIGHRTPKTRSELIQMGFDANLVDSLPTFDTLARDGQTVARNQDLGGGAEQNPSMDRSQDLVYLGEYYMHLDVDEDGEGELWRLFTVGNTLLEKEQWDVHPFCVFVPVPIPHRAVGTCPAEQVADIQLANSVLVRNLLDNIYSTNYQRVAYNDRVDLDDLFTPRPGGGVHVEGEGPIGDSILPFTTIPQSDGILQAIEYMNTAREVRTGVTRYNQGLDTDSLNKTATGFRGIMDASQQRQELIARLAADGIVKDIGRKTIALLAKHQDTALQIRVTGKPLEVDPTSWRHNLDCFVEVGLGTGDRNEKLQNLGFIYEIQRGALEAGLPISDPAKMFHTLDKVVEEIGLKEGSTYFNDPEQPEMLLQFQNFMLQQQLAALEANANPLAEAELVKAQARLAEVDGKLANEREQFAAKMTQEDRHFEAELRKEIVELRAKVALMEAQRLKTLQEARAQETDTDLVEAGVIGLEAPQENGEA